MSFFLFIIILIGFFFVYPIFKAGRAVNRARKDFQRAFDQQNGANRGNAQQDNRRHEYDPTTGREKKYTKDEGEYVEFEECTEPAPSGPQRTEKATQYRQEEQISDAEFEDIP